MDLGLHYWNFSVAGNPQRIADTLAALRRPPRRPVSPSVAALTKRMRLAALESPGA